MTSWCILRCSNSKTLELASSLNDAGFEAWSPVDADAAPMTGCYVFARLEQLTELLALSRSPSLLYRVWDTELRRMVTRGLPYFRVLPDPFTTWATVSEAQLAPLRGIERKRKPRGVVKIIPPGTVVRLTEGGFAGMDGIVSNVNGKRAMVAFEGFPFPVEIPCWVLSETLDEQAAVNVNRHSSERAYRAA